MSETFDIPLFLRRPENMTEEEKQQRRSECRVDRVVSGLDARMKAAGMMTVKEMLGSNALGKFSAHAGVTSLESFEEWIQMRRREFITAQATMTLDEKEDDEMFEWVVAHNAVLGEVMANFRQAISADH